MSTQVLNKTFVKALPAETQKTLEELLSTLSVETQTQIKNIYEARKSTRKPRAKKEKAPEDPSKPKSVTAYQIFMRKAEGTYEEKIGKWKLFKAAAVIPGSKEASELEQLGVEAQAEMAEKNKDVPREKLSPDGKHLKYSEQTGKYKIIVENKKPKKTVVEEESPSEEEDE